MSNLPLDYTTRARARTVAALIKLANEAETLEGVVDNESEYGWKNGADQFFTCQRVAVALGDKFAKSYCSLFIDNEIDLWHDRPMPRRILSLCFMAAMVGAGDA